MTDKRKPIKREVRCLYKALLKEDGEQVSVTELVGHYLEYNAFRQKILNSRVASARLKANLPPLKTPKYVSWVQKYLVEEVNNEGISNG